MASNISDPEERRLLDLSLVNVDVALYTSAPGVETGTGGTEVSGGSYARSANPSFNAAATASNVTTKALTSDLTFPTATVSWGTVTHVAFIARTGQADAGTVRWSGPLTASKTIDVGDTFVLQASAFSAGLD